MIVEIYKGGASFLSTLALLYVRISRIKEQFLRRGVIQTELSKMVNIVRWLISLAVGTSGWLRKFKNNETMRDLSSIRTNIGLYVLITVW